MVENPILTKQSKAGEDYVHKFRDENPEAFKGNALFIIKGFKKESDRIDVPIYLPSASNQRIYWRAY